MYTLGRRFLGKIWKWNHLDCAGTFVLGLHIQRRRGGPSSLRYDRIRIESSCIPFSSRSWMDKILSIIIHRRYCANGINSLAFRDNMSFEWSQTATQSTLAGWLACSETDTNMTPLRMKRTLPLEEPDSKASYIIFIDHDDFKGYHVWIISNSKYY
jgi:hypothetical protein